MPPLGQLCLFKLFRACREIGARILLVFIKEQFKQLILEIIVMLHMRTRRYKRIVLLEAAQPARKAVPEYLGGGTVELPPVSVEQTRRSYMSPSTTSRLPSM